MSLWLTEQGIEHLRVFADTGWEHPDTYEYIRGPLQDKIGPIDWVASPIGGMREWCLKKGMFPSRVGRWCTSKLKIEPLAEYMAAIDGTIINAVGVRAAESRARAGLPEREPWSALDDVEVWRPLLRWSEADVIAMHRRHGLVPNPLYFHGAERVGCWPCIFARKREIRFMAELTPDRVEEIRQLEAEVATAAAERYARRGETFESLGYRPPTMFHKHNGDGMYPIDDVIAWSKTARGGRQQEWWPDDEPGCVRWGMCGS